MEFLDHLSYKTALEALKINANKRIPNVYNQT
jgi:hypothetical protein